MGMLIDFYTGDKERIVDALKSGDMGTPASDSYVIANADFSFHLSIGDLDQLVLSACALLDNPPITFSESIESINADLLVPATDPENGIHEMSNAFTDLFAAVPAEHATKLYELWCAKLPEPPKPSSETIFQHAVRKVKQGMVLTVFTIMLSPIFAAIWLFSPNFRKERKLNKMKRDLEKKEVEAAPQYTLKNAIEALIHTCQTAKAHGKKVICAWSI
jgi:hypothetical protein